MCEVCGGIQGGIPERDCGNCKSNWDELDAAREKDSKGWILFKSGKASEGLALVMEAPATVPDDPDVQSHLSAIRRTSIIQTK